MPSTWIPTAIGFAIAVFGGLLIAIPLRAASRLLDVEGDDNARVGQWTALSVGIVERILYTSSFLVGQSGFVAVWFGLKGISGWKRWEENRKLFQVFLIGSGLSLMYSYVGYLVIGWIMQCRMLDGLVVFGLLLALTILLRVYYDIEIHKLRRSNG